MSTQHPDAEVIKALGGAAELARKLGFDPAHGGVQRCHNWGTRGIPSSIRLNHPDVFGLPTAPPQPSPRRRKNADTEQRVG